MVEVVCDPPAPASVDRANANPACSKYGASIPCMDSGISGRVGTPAASARTATACAGTAGTCCPPCHASDSGYAIVRKATGMEDERINKGLSLPSANAVPSGMDALCPGDIVYAATAGSVFVPVTGRAKPAASTIRSMRCSIEVSPCAAAVTPDVCALIVA